MAITAITAPAAMGSTGMPHPALHTGMVDHKPAAFAIWHALLYFMGRWAGQWHGVVNAPSNKVFEGLDE